MMGLGMVTLGTSSVLELERHDLGDGPVLHRAQRLGSDCFGHEELLARLQQVGRAQEAADVVVAKGQCGARCHGA
jgi:hypothetical protein